MFHDATQIIYTPLGYDSPDWGAVAVPLHPRSMEKLAGSSYIPEKLLDFMDRIRPRDDGRYVLLNAIGALEYWGPNKNADGFPEWSLKQDPIPPNVQQYLREHSLPIPQEWGYQTFERYGYPYMHHNNGDPVLTIGERVCCAAYNDRMHRIELIVFIRKDKASDVVRKIDEGVPVPWSMGSKLPFDVCSVCFKPSTRREDYCVHLKDMANQILPDGTKVFSYNYFPRFFDISVVIVPADRSAYSLKKVASFEPTGGAGRVFDFGPSSPPIHVPDGMTKFAGLFNFLAKGATEKQAEIVKEIPAQEPAKNLGPSPMDPDLWRFIFDMVAKDRGAVEPIKTKDIEEFHGFPVDKILHALTSIGVILTPHEADGIIGDREIPEGLDLREPEPTLMNRLKPYVGSRSMFDPHFTRRVSEERNEAPNLRMVKRGAYDRYKRWLQQVSLEKLSEVTAHPAVRMLLSPSIIEDKMLELEEKSAGDHAFERMVMPFVAGASFGE